MSAGIFVAGVFVTLIVCAAMGLLIWGFRVEARANARERQALEGDDGLRYEAANEIRHPGPDDADGQRQPEPQRADASKDSL